jgi:hypothetical protein
VTAYNVGVFAIGITGERKGRKGRALRALVVVTAATACGAPRAEAPAPAAADVRAAETPSIGQTTRPHGNHDPKFGGVVLMNGDLHFEVVLGRDGRRQVYFSDAAREELPASIASSVSVAVTSPDGAGDTVPLAIDDTGESWVGAGRPVTDPRATARITYTIRGKPYWIDLPFSAMPAESVTRGAR